MGVKITLFVLVANGLIAALVKAGVEIDGVDMIVFIAVVPTILIVVVAGLIGVSDLLEFEVITEADDET